VTILVVAEAVAILLLGVLVAGLLRSHADILRSLHGLETGSSSDDLSLGQVGAATRAVRFSPGTGPPAQGKRPAFDLVGTSPTGDAMQVGLLGAGHDTLLAFLSSGCESCGVLWAQFDQGPVAVPGGARLVIVTKGSDEESVPLVASLTPATVTTVMSSAAWADYQVPVYPYFIYVHGPSGQVIGEGAAASWSHITSLLRQALADAGLLDPALASPVGGRRHRVDDELAAAGIHPGHPSLYPPVAVPSSEDGDERDL
jgi:hypothetical protein